MGKANPVLIRVLAFGPPLHIALIRDIFLKPIDFTGGFGIVTLFGILPGIIATRKAVTRRPKILALVMLLLFSVFFLLETSQEFGLLKISPDVEYWK
jgi:tyrosine-specific transport protein